MPSTQKKNSKEHEAPKGVEPAESHLPAAGEGNGPTTQRHPCFRSRFGRVEAAVWDKELENGGRVFSVTMHRSYKDQDGTWHRTTSMDEHDLLPAAEAMRECYVFIQKQRQAAFANGNGHD